VALLTVEGLVLYPHTYPTIITLLKYSQVVDSMIT